MSKLTEIKEIKTRIIAAANFAENDDHYELFNDARKMINDLIFLLEEKDKALKELSEESNWFKVTDRVDQSFGLKLPEPWAWKDQRNPCEIARKALNTSSNNGGEKDDNSWRS